MSELTQTVETTLSAPHTEIATAADGVLASIELGREQVTDLTGKAQIFIDGLKTLRDRIAAIEIASVADRDELLATIRLLTDAKGKLSERWKRLTKPANDLHKSITSLAREMDNIVEDGRIIANRKVNTWNDEQRRIAEAEAAERQRKAREQAEAEALARAEQLEAAGHAQAAEALLEQPVKVAPVAVVTPGRAVGQRTRVTWQWRVIDTAAIPQDYYKMILDVDKIVATVKSLKGDTRISGIEVYPETTNY